MKDWLLVTKLSETFNAEATDVKAVLAKYNAELRTIGFGGIGPGQPPIDVAEGVQEKDQAAFIKEFKALSGVELAYVIPFPCFGF